MEIVRREAAKVEAVRMEAVHMEAARMEAVQMGVVQTKVVPIKAVRMEMVHMEMERDFSMHSKQIKPISYLKAHAAKVLVHLEKSRVPIIITQNGEAKAVLQDMDSYHKTQETLALLKLLALGQKQVEAKEVISLEEAVRHLKAKRNTSK